MTFSHKGDRTGFCRFCVFFAYSHACLYGLPILLPLVTFVLYKADGIIDNVYNSYVEHLSGNISQRDLG